MDEANAHPFPREVKFWTTADVGYFLTTLGLRQYRKTFEEAAVDGDFLLALNPHDCADVLGVEHALHLKKLFLGIDKLRPLTNEDQRKKVCLSLSPMASWARSLTVQCNRNRNRNHSSTRHRSASPAVYVVSLTYVLYSVHTARS